MGTEFRACDQVLEKFDNFKYPCRIMTLDDSDWPVVSRNLQREQRKPGRFYHLLVHEGENTRSSGRFYMAVVQSVMILGSDS